MADAIVLVGGPRDGALVAVPDLPRVYRMSALAGPVNYDGPFADDPVPSVEWAFHPRGWPAPDRNPDGAALYDVQPERRVNDRED